MGTVSATADRYNAAEDLLGRNHARSNKVAFVDAVGSHTFGAVDEGVGKLAAGFHALGLKPGDRLIVCVTDGIAFVVSFLASLKTGVVPICLNTLFKSGDYAYILNDSNPSAVIVSESLAPLYRDAAAQSGWAGKLIVVGAAGAGETGFSSLMQHGARKEYYSSSAEDIAFWLYSSGSTGRPKGTPHRHSSLARTAELFGQDTLGLKESDVIYSAAKLFFAYGLGNALTFPMYAGATAILYPDRVSPEAAIEMITQHGATVFFGAPTLYAGMLAAGAGDRVRGSKLRLCVSAGEALPSTIAERWAASTGLEIVDGIGSTEMLHIYISNRPADIAYGTTGRPVPGYDVRVVDENGMDTADGEFGELYVRGPTMTPFYWNQAEKTASTFVDGWMRTGDKFVRGVDGRYTHCGRVDDMLKVSGNWVSPMEVENVLMSHGDVLEAAVIGVKDAAGLVKSMAFVVCRPGLAGSAELAAQLKQHAKTYLAPYKYPRVIEFVSDLPKTATGKVQRHVLRSRAALQGDQSG